MSNYRSTPTRHEPAKKSGGLIKILLAGIVGLVLGYLSPVSIFG